MADDSSVLVQFSALNVYQNTELNPDAPEYIPVPIHSTSGYFYFQHLHHQSYYPPPPPPPPPPPQPEYAFYPVSYYFQPSFQLIPQPHFTQLVPNPPIPWSQPFVDHVQGNDHDITGCENGSRRRLDGRWKRRGSGSRIWRVRSGRRSSTYPTRRNESASDENSDSRVTLTSSSVNDGQLKRDSGGWRTVKYRATKNHGKKFEIEPVEKSVKKTTVMIRNIPSRYTREAMLTFLDRHCMEVNQSCSSEEDRGSISAFDFFYMPMDFKTGLNKSYAFVNFTTPEAVWRFHKECDTQKWELFESNKIRQIALAKLQGTGELIEHFCRTAFACDQDEFLPVCFQPPRDGRDDVERVTSLIGKRVR